MRDVEVTKMYVRYREGLPDTGGWLVSCAEGVRTQGSCPGFVYVAMGR